MAVCQLIGPDDPRWRDTCLAAASQRAHLSVEVPGEVSSEAHRPSIGYDTYHLPEYSTVCATFEGGRPAAILYKDSQVTILIPVLLRRLPANIETRVLSAIPTASLPLPRATLGETEAFFVDAFSPYGYPGPVVLHQATVPIEERRAIESEAQSSICSMLVSFGVVSLFVRFHPLFAADHDLKPTFGTMSQPSQTVFIDLTDSLETISKNMEKSHRQGIKKLYNLGFSTVANDFSYLTEFIRIYHATMDRVAATANYYFSTEYFEELIRALDSRVHLIVGLSPEGTVVSGGLFFQEDGIVQFHLSASDPEFRNLAPGKMIADAAISLFKSRGQRCLHFGGGVGGRDDSLLAYKQRFSPHRGHFRVWKAVVNEPLFCVAMGNTAVSDEHFEGFFPPYRRQPIEDSRV